MAVAEDYKTIEDIRNENSDAHAVLEKLASIEEVDRQDTYSTFQLPGTPPGLNITDGDQMLATLEDAGLITVGDYNQVAIHWDRVDALAQGAPNLDVEQMVRDALDSDDTVVVGDDAQNIPTPNTQSTNAISAEAQQIIDALQQNGGDLAEAERSVGHDPNTRANVFAELEEQGVVRFEGQDEIIDTRRVNELATEPIQVVDQVALDGDDITSLLVDNVLDSIPGLDHSDSQDKNTTVSDSSQPSLDDAQHYVDQDFDVTQLSENARRALEMLDDDFRSETGISINGIKLNLEITGSQARDVANELVAEEVGALESTNFRTGFFIQHDRVEELVTALRDQGIAPSQQVDTTEVQELTNQIVQNMYEDRYPGELGDLVVSPQLLQAQEGIADEHVAQAAFNALVDDGVIINVDANNFGIVNVNRVEEIGSAINPVTDLAADVSGQLRDAGYQSGDIDLVRLEQVTGLTGEDLTQAWDALEAAGVIENSQTADVNGQEYRRGTVNYDALDRAADRVQGQGTDNTVDQAPGPDVALTDEQEVYNSIPRFNRFFDGEGPANREARENAEKGIGFLVEHLGKDAALALVTNLGSTQPIERLGGLADYVDAQVHLQEAMSEFELTDDEVTAVEKKAIDSIAVDRPDGEFSQPIYELPSNDRLITLTELSDDMATAFDDLIEETGKNSAILKGCQGCYAEEGDIAPEKVVGSLGYSTSLDDANSPIGKLLEWDDVVPMAVQAAGLAQVNDLIMNTIDHLQDAARLNGEGFDRPAEVDDLLARITLDDGSLDPSALGPENIRAREAFAQAVTNAIGNGTMPDDFQTTAQLRADGEFHVGQTSFSTGIPDAIDYENYYDVLGVPPDADEELIRHGYRKAAMENHPDVVVANYKNEHPDATAQEISDVALDAEDDIRLINEANRVLANPDARELYDAALNQFGHDEALVILAVTERDIRDGVAGTTYEATTDLVNNHPEAFYSLLEAEGLTDNLPDDRSRGGIRNIFRSTPDDVGPSQAYAQGAGGGAPIPDGDSTFLRTEAVQQGVEKVCMMLHESGPPAVVDITGSGVKDLVGDDLADNVLIALTQDGVITSAQAGSLGSDQAYAIDASAVKGVHDQIGKFSQEAYRVELNLDLRLTLDPTHVDLYIACKNFGDAAGHNTHNDLEEMMTWVNEPESTPWPDSPTAELIAQKTTGFDIKSDLINVMVAWAEVMPDEDVTATKNEAIDFVEGRLLAIDRDLILNETAHYRLETAKEVYLQSSAHAAEAIHQDPDAAVDKRRALIENNTTGLTRNVQNELSADLNVMAADNESVANALNNASDVNNTLGQHTTDRQALEDKLLAAAGAVASATGQDVSTARSLTQEWLDTEPNDNEVTNRLMAAMGDLDDFDRLKNVLGKHLMQQQALNNARDDHNQDVDGPGGGGGGDDPDKDGPSPNNGGLGQTHPTDRQNQGNVNGTQGDSPSLGQQFMNALDAETVHAPKNASKDRKLGKAALLGVAALGMFSVAPVGIAIVGAVILGAAAWDAAGGEKNRKNDFGGQFGALATSIVDGVNSVVSGGAMLVADGAKIVKNVAHIAKERCQESDRNISDYGEGFATGLEFTARAVEGAARAVQGVLGGHGLKGTADAVMHSKKISDKAPDPAKAAADGQSQTHGQTAATDGQNQTTPTGQTQQAQGGVDPTIVKMMVDQARDIAELKAMMRQAAAGASQSQPQGQTAPVTGDQQNLGNSQSVADDGIDLSNIKGLSDISGIDLSAPADKNQTASGAGVPVGAAASQAGKSFVDRLDLSDEPGPANGRTH